LDDASGHNSTRCLTIPGGLVEGNVSYLTTGSAINGAKVVSNDAPADNATTAAVPEDPNNPGGFYYLFSTLTGSHPFTASASNHSPDTETANVAANGTVRRNFALGSAHLVITPSSITKTQVLGSTTTQTLTIKNDGTGSGHVVLNEQGGGFQILGLQGAPLSNIKLPGDEDGGDGGADPGWLGDHTNDHAPAVFAGAPKDPTWATIA